MAAPLKIVAIWNTLHEHVRSRGGEIISVPNRFPATIVCKPESTLLRELELMVISFTRATSTVPENIQFTVKRGQPWQWLNPTGAIVEIAGVRSSPPPRVANVSFDQLDEYEVDLKRAN
jgi:hypothetical protein